MSRKPKEEWVNNLPKEFWEENKGVPDYKLLGKIEGLNTLNILRRVRKKLGKRNSLDIFDARFNRKYGEGACIRLRQMLEDPLVALNDVGGYFGFTRQAASLYFKKIYGKTYRQCKPNRNEVKLPYERDTNGRIYKICKEGRRILRREGGFRNIEIVPWKSSYRLMVEGGIFVAVRRFYWTKPFGKKSRVRFWSAVKGRTPADFFLCYSRKGDRYIIPSLEMPEGLSIPPYGREGKYSVYRNGWERLRDGRRRKRKR
jgi:hypothetical protein